MKHILSYILIFLSISFNQDSRSIIFNTGTPETEDGYLIDINNSIANRFTPSSDFAMEAFKVSMILQSESGTALISIHDDNNNHPGEILGEWELTLANLGLREYLVYTFQDCILFNENQNYWISVRAGTAETTATWVYSPSIFYTYSSSSDNQLSWETSTGAAGSCKVYAEEFFYPEIALGDINEDSSIDVIDIVMIVAYITNTGTLLDNQIINGDVNLDQSLDVLDIVQLVGDIVNTEPMPNFSLLDFNPNSDYFNQSIGPETFSNEVSCYYFGKQG